MKNTLLTFLEQLGVPHTRQYANRLYAEHPNRHNMLGLSQMLQTYGVRTQGVHLPPERLADLPMPCILHLSGRFVVAVEATPQGRIGYVWQGGRRYDEAAALAHQFSGNALLAEATAGATEPDLQRHRLNQWMGQAQWAALGAAALLYALLALLLSRTAPHALTAAFMATDVAGIGLCLLLLQKQVAHGSRLADRVCTMFHQSDCSPVLTSRAARIGPSSWSEAGMGFFAAHLLYAASHPEAAGALSLTLWCAMAYGVWSVYYQAAVIRQWCVLCLLVQGVVWAGGIAAALLWRGSLTATSTWVAQLVQWGALAALAVVVTHKLAEGTTQARGSLEATYRYRALKADVGVFTALLRRAPYHATSAADSAIVIGPADAALGITILTNPHCEPCGRMHQRVEQLLQAAGQGQVSVRYIFKSFTEELEESSRFLIAAHQQLPPAEARRVYAEWYAGGKYHARAFMARHPQVEAHTPQVEAELARHHAWQARTGLVATPTVLVGGYVLPPEYTLEDLLPLAGRELDLTPPQGHTTENIIDDIGANKRPLRRPRRHEPRE